MKDEASREFSKALRKLPPPLSCFSDGAGCPWCGALHNTVTFGANNCSDCGRFFCFGYPDWHGDKDPISWVPFPFKAFDAVGRMADKLEDWRPNERLQHLYFQKSEERIGVSADTSKRN